MFERNSYLIVCYVMSCLIGGVMAEKRLALAAKEAAQKLRYNGMKACRIEGIVSARDLYSER